MLDQAKPYINPYLAGALLGVVLFLAFFITGTGLGASGGLNRMLVFFQNLAVPEHIDQVPYLLKMAGGSFGFRSTVLTERRPKPSRRWPTALNRGNNNSGIFGR